MLQKEGILEVLPLSQQKSHDVIEFFVITQYASILHMKYKISNSIILDPIRINLKVKELLNYKIDQIMVAENLSLAVGGPAMTMLIKEHNLLC